MTRCAVLRGRLQLLCVLLQCIISTFYSIYLYHLYIISQYQVSYYQYIYMQCIMCGCAMQEVANGVLYGMSSATCVQMMVYIECMRLNMWVIIIK